MFYQLSRVRILYSVKVPMGEDYHMGINELPNKSAGWKFFIQWRFQWEKIAGGKRWSAKQISGVKILYSVNVPMEKDYHRVTAEMPNNSAGCESFIQWRLQWERITTWANMNFSTNHGGRILYSVNIPMGENCHKVIDELPNIMPLVTLVSLVLKNKKHYVCCIL